MSPRRPLGSALVALCLLAPAVSSAMDEKEFKKQFQNTQNSWERRALIAQLDPGDDDQLDLLLKFVLQTQEWYYREAAIEALSTAYDPGLIAKLEKMGDKKPMIAEGIAMAFGRSKNTDRVPHLLELLQSKKWVVRRAAAVALPMVPDKRSIGALIKAWEEEDEDKFIVWVHYLESLEQLTYQTNMPDVQDWKDWWAVNEDSFSFEKAKADAEAKGGDGKSGDLLTTRVRGTNLTTRLRGSGLPLLVLPDYGYEQDYLETYLRNLEDTNQIIYASLPGTSDFVDPPLQNAPGLPNPYYPLERIVDAFEELHNTLEKDGKIEGKFAIMAHGISNWIAMTFAARHPRSVRRMILVAANSGQKAAGEGIDRLVRQGQETGDVEQEHYGMSRQYNSQKGAYDYEAKSDPEREALQRKSLTVRFADRRDLEIGRIYGGIEQRQIGDKMFVGPKFVRPMGGCFIPEFSLFKLERVQTPTLVMVGKYAVESNGEDAKAIAKHYGGNARALIFKRSGEMPFIEENEQFVETVRKFLGGKKKRKRRR